MREKEDAFLLVVKVCPGQDTATGHWISLEGRIMYVKKENMLQESSFFLD